MDISLRCLLKSPEFASRITDPSFRARFEWYSQECGDYVVRLFVNPGFCMFLHNLEFQKHLDCIRGLFASRHPGDAWNHICELLQNQEFCECAQSNKIVFAIQEINDRYPIGDVLKLFTTPGFCKAITDLKFRACFRKLEFELGNIVEMFACSEFIQNIHALQPLIPNYVRVFGKLAVVTIFSCPEFCRRGDSCNQDLVTQFGQVQAAKLLASSKFYTNHIYSNALVGKFGVVLASKLLRKSNHCQEALDYPWAINKTNAVKLLCCDTLAEVGWATNLLGENYAVKLLLQDSFRVRVSDPIFQQSCDCLAYACGSRLYAFQLLKVDEICARLDQSDFCARLCELIYQKGPNAVCRLADARK